MNAVEYLGLTITKQEVGRIEAVMQVKEIHTQVFNVLHGGVSLMVCETLAGMGSLMLLEGEEIPAGVWVEGKHEHPVPLGSRLLFTAILTEKNERQHHWKIEMYHGLKRAHSCKVICQIVSKNIFKRS